MKEIISITAGVEYSKGSIVSKQIINKKTGTVTLFAFDKGQSLSEHTAPFDAMAQVTDGTATVIIGGEPQKVKTGEMIIMPANITHAVKADVKFKMLLTMIRG